MFFEKIEVLIFKITEREIIFCHYPIISVVQLYICLPVPFLLFGKAMSCISKKQGFGNQQTGIWMLVLQLMVPSLSSHFTSRRHRLTIAKTGRRAPTSKTSLLNKRTQGLAVSTLELVLSGTFLSPCFRESAVPRADQARAGPNGVFLWLSNWRRVHLSLGAEAPRCKVELHQQEGTLVRGGGWSPSRDNPEHIPVVWQAQMWRYSSTVWLFNFLQNKTQGPSK